MTGRSIFLAICIISMLFLPGHTGAREQGKIPAKDTDDTAQDAGILELNTPVQGYFYPENDQDWFKIHIEAPEKGIYHIDLKGVPEVDSSIEFYSPEGGQLKLINSAPAGQGESIVNMGLRAGSTLILLRGAGKNPDVPYEFSVNAAGIWKEGMEFEPNDSMPGANSVPQNTVLSASIHPVRDQDWFMCRFNRAERILAEVQGIKDRDISLDLYDESGKQLLRVNSGIKGEGEILCYPAKRAGSYFIRVAAADRAEIMEYRLSIEKAVGREVDQQALKSALRRALDYLQNSRDEDGTWEGRHGDTSGVIGLALMAFLESEKCTGRTYKAAIQTCLARLKDHYQPSSRFPEGSREQAHFGGLLATRDILYSHSIALIALMRAMEANQDDSLRPIIEDGLNVLIRSQNVLQKPEHLDGPVTEDSRHYGGWRWGPGNLDSDLSVTAWVIFALAEGLRMGWTLPDWTFPEATRFVKRCYINDTEGFSLLARARKKGCARTASGVLSLQILDRSDDPEVIAGCEYILQHPPIWNREQVGGGFPFYYWHHATRALRARGGPDWEFWKGRLAHLLITHQNEDGSWTAGQKESYYSAAYPAALGALILELICDEGTAAQ